MIIRKKMFIFAKIFESLYNLKFIYENKKNIIV
jgi:hypothetical protein